SEGHGIFLPAGGHGMDQSAGRAPIRLLASPETLARYRVELLAWAETGPHGVAHLAGGSRATLPWASVLHARAALVGEPEGVRTVVFDLIVERKETECLVCRFDAEPGPEAQAIAGAIAAGVGRDRCAR